MQEEALKTGAATEGEVRVWKQEVEERDERGEFFSVVTMAVVAGQKVRQEKGR